MRQNFLAAIVHRRRLLAGLTALALGLGCSDDPGAPTDPGPDVPALDADPDGIFLPGTDGTLVLDAIRAMPPSAVPPDEVGDDGFLPTRITALPAPDATVSALNMALDAHGARIVSMRWGTPSLTLVVPAQANHAAARTLADALEATDAILLAFPAYEARMEPPSGGLLRTGEPRVDPIPDHLARLRAPAAGNVRRLAETTAAPVTVLVPDGYHQLVSHPDIPAQSFASGPGGIITGPGPDGTHFGNHGFHVSGILGADPGSDAYAGVHPTPSPSQLRLRSIPISGLTYDELFNELARQMPTSGAAVINVSLGYNDPAFTRVPLIQRVIDAASYRLSMTEHAARVLLAASAGNDGAADGDGALARYSSAFNVSASFADLGALAAEDTTATEALRLELGLLLAAYPETAVQPTNVLRVGSSDLAGEESIFSCTGSDVRVIGERIPGPCGVEDPSHATNPDDCDGSVAHYSGTSMAAPQVAGIAAYLWNLSPTRTPEEVRTILHDAYAFSSNPGILDAYLAVLALDRSMDDPRVRMALLDVADGSGNPGTNGAFDDHDLRIFLDQFDAHAPRRGADPDFSRFDLNGDGYTGAVGFEPFDLDVNEAPTFSTVTQEIEGRETSFDETSLDDRQILCYYAYSSLYTGDEDLRRQVFADDHGQPQQILVGTVEWDHVTYEGFASPLRVRAGYLETIDPDRGDRGQDPDWTAGIDVVISVTGGTASVTSGETDADGWFDTAITPDDGEDQVVITVDLDDGLGRTELLQTSGEVVPAGIVVLYGSIGLSVEQDSRIRSPSGVQGAWLYDMSDHDGVDLDDGASDERSFSPQSSGSFDLGDRTLQAESAATMSGANTTTASGGSSVTMTVSGSSETTATIENVPDDDAYWSWHVRSTSVNTSQRFFRVEGLPVRATVSVGYPRQGTLAFFRTDSEYYLCWNDQSGHCSKEVGEWTSGEDGTATWEGILEPGFQYTFYSTVGWGSSRGVRISNETDPPSGTRTEPDAASVTVTLETIPPGELRAMGRSPRGS